MKFRFYCFHNTLIFLVIIAMLSSGADAACSEKYYSLGEISETVDFYFCKTPRDQTIFIDGTALDEGTAGNGGAIGWSWKTQVSDMDKYYKISYTITSDAIYHTQTNVSLAYMLNGTETSKYVDLVVLKPGPPRMKSSHSTTWTFGAQLGKPASSAVEIFNPQLGEQLAIGVARLPSEYTLEDDADGNFYVDWSTSHAGLVVTLTFAVSSTQEADVGEWEVNVTNKYGDLTITVSVRDFGLPALCGEETENKTLLADDGESLNISLCVLVKRDHTAVVKSVTPPHTLETDDYKTSLWKKARHRNKHDLLLSIKKVTHEHLGHWKVTVDDRSYHTLGVPLSSSEFTFNIAAKEHPEPEAKFPSFVITLLSVQGFLAVVIIATLIMCIKKCMKNRANQEKLAEQKLQNLTKGSDT